MIRTTVIVILIIVALYITYLFILPLGRPFVQPAVIWWYGNEFVLNAESAATKLPDTENRCIFDDSRNIFVESFSELDVNRIIDKALDDKYPRFRMERPLRDPHFRVLSNERTYYWSFREKKFFAFRGDRWTLKGGLSQKMCDYYTENPESFEMAFWERDGVSVERRHFCCDLAAGANAGPE